MLLGIQVFQGKDCNFKQGCKIRLTPDGEAQRFNSNTRYYLVDGDVSIEYEGEPQQVMSSPYGSNWSSYVNSWDYSKDVSLTVLPTTLFVKVSLIDKTSNTELDQVSSVIKLENTSITKSMNSNTSMIVVGSTYTVDGNEYTNQIARVIPAKTAREVTISTQNSCSLIYIEPI